MENNINTSRSRSILIRNLISFWIFGLCNNYGYVVMLSAAHDILKDHTNNATNNNTNVTSTINTNSIENTSEAIISQIVHGSLHLKCNKITTGAILLADILPAVLIKLTAPLFTHLFSYNFRLILISCFSVGSFLIVALSPYLSLTIFGVVCASLSSGYGEVTFLSLSSFYNKKTVSTWSSGTGMAGLLGSVSYAGLIAIGLNATQTLLSMLIVPILMFLVYFLVLVHNYSNDNISVSHCANRNSETIPIIISDDDLDDDSFSSFDSSLSTTPRNTLCEREKNLTKLEIVFSKLLLIRSLILPYMLPLGLVYFSEYFINQALFELLQFKNTSLSLDSQYRWYQVLYQTGVFLSRSSVNCIRIRWLWIMPILQAVNLILLLLQSIYRFIPFIWIIMIIILYEGCLGGAAYVNTFYTMSEKILEMNLEFSLGVASIADSFGILISAFVSFPVHNAICGK